jgi:hypothetical protein
MLIVVTASCDDRIENPNEALLMMPRSFQTSALSLLECFLIALLLLPMINLYRFFPVLELAYDEAREVNAGVTTLK